MYYTMKPLAVGYKADDVQYRNGDKGRGVVYKALLLALPRSGNGR